LETQNNEREQLEKLVNEKEQERKEAEEVTLHKDRLMEIMKENQYVNR